MSKTHQHITHVGEDNVYPEQNDHIEQLLGMGMNDGTAFAAWAKRSKRYKEISESMLGWGQRGQLLEICQAAYKAGERKGRKDAEALCRNAIELRQMMGIGK